ncbi:MAG TPA: citrate/2-methylcitrate synthase [Polyangiaceae bacterium]|nr:citrate/2-methylcitrate synthase [Polyangiaceae bacterium]
MSTHLSATAAAQRLGVSRATLYAYVSRGLVRSRAVSGHRAREYAREDIEQLVAQTRGRRDPLGVAQRALAFEGLPVLSSALSLIDGGRLYYRGRDAVELSRAAQFEEVAALLWDGPCVVRHAAPPIASVRRRLAQLDFAAAGVAHLSLAGTCDVSASERAPAAVRASGGRIVGELSQLAAGFATGQGNVAARVAQAFGARGPRARRAIEAALILCADHELNASAFAARVIAATGATPSMAVVGALGALSGARHGGMTDGVWQMFDALARPSSASALLAEPLRRGDAVPGFGHPLYPDGDPRGARLLELCTSNGESRRAAALRAAAERALGAHPNVDFGLVALCRSLGLPRHAPFVLFALGRSAGWVGHAIEQYATGSLIRPRARYVGVAPSRS